VLIVDDEPEALQLFRRMLISEDQEYRVITASNGKQALQVLENETPDVILLDLIMPEMDGYQVIEALSQNSRLSSIPVIVISANDQMNQALITETMAVWRTGGFTTSQLLASIRDISQILGTPGLSVDLASPTDLPG
jgi:CheY-like chemotaxis protein